MANEGSGGQIMLNLLADEERALHAATERLMAVQNEHAQLAQNVRNIKQAIELMKTVEASR